jgi:hypothetical protein
MMALNVWRAIGEFTQDILFIPYDILRSVAFESWWRSNVVSIALIGTGIILFLYWLMKLQSFRRAGTE